MFKPLVFSVAMAIASPPVTAVPGLDDHGQGVIDNRGYNQTTRDHSAEGSHRAGKSHLGSGPKPDLPQQAMNCRPDSGLDPGEVNVVHTAQYDFCVPKVRPQGPRPLVAEAEATVKQLFQRSALPIPAPTLSARSEGICGVRHSLDLHTETRATYTYLATDFGDVSIDAGGVNHIDWGDESPIDITTSVGGPWPHAEISHVWTRAGSYDVHVTTTWTARWTLRSTDGVEFSGEVDNVSTHGEINDFTVVQAQAVLIQ